MDEDFNTALALSELYRLFKTISAKLSKGDASAAEDVYQIRKTYSLLGLFKKDAAEYLSEVSLKNPVEIPNEVKEIAHRRWQAKLARDWAEADKLRGELDSMGYLVKDSKENYTIIKK